VCDSGKGAGAGAGVGAGAEHSLLVTSPHVTAPGILCKSCWKVFPGYDPLFCHQLWNCESYTPTPRVDPNHTWEAHCMYQLLCLVYKGYMPLEVIKMMVSYLYYGSITQIRLNEEATRQLRRDKERQRLKFNQMKNGFSDESMPKNGEPVRTRTVNHSLTHSLT